MTSLKVYKARNDRAHKDVEKAEKEIAKLQRELKAGTLDRKRLESGLKKVQGYVGDIPVHIPIFSKDI